MKNLIQSLISVIFSIHSKIQILVISDIVIRWTSLVFNPPLHNIRFYIYDIGMPFV